MRHDPKTRIQLPVERRRRPGALSGFERSVRLQRLWTFHHLRGRGVHYRLLHHHHGGLPQSGGGLYGGVLPRPCGLCVGGCLYLRHCVQRAGRAGPVRSGPAAGGGAGRRGDGRPGRRAGGHPRPAPAGGLSGHCHHGLCRDHPGGLLQLCDHRRGPHHERHPQTVHLWPHLLDHGRLCGGDVPVCPQQVRAHGAGHPGGLHRGRGLGHQRHVL